MQSLPVLSGVEVIKSPGLNRNDQMLKQLKHQAVRKLHVFILYSKPSSLL